MRVRSLEVGVVKRYVVSPHKWGAVVRPEDCHH